MIENFTYEDIYELLRVEKFSAEIQKINEEDLSKINDYLQIKEKLLGQEESTSMMSSTKRVKILTEIENAKRTLGDLYEKRERKIINRAITTIRSGNTLKDTTNMLKFEIELYNNLISLLQNNKSEFFNTIYSAEKNRDILEKEMAEIEKMRSEMDLAEQTANIKKKEVKFLEDSEQFYGEDLKTYGPYKKGEKDRLPEKIAKLLIEQKKIKLSEDESSKTDE